METTKQKQITGLVLGAISVFLPNISNAIPTDDPDTAIGGAIAIIIICLAAMICGIIGIIISAGARKEATAAGEKKVIGTIGLIASIVGTVYGAILFFVLGVCVACVVCLGAAAMSA